MWCGTINENLMMDFAWFLSSFMLLSSTSNPASCALHFLVVYSIEWVLYKISSNIDTFFSIQLLFHAIPLPMTKVPLVNHWILGDVVCTWFAFSAMGFQCWWLEGSIIKYCYIEFQSMTWQPYFWVPYVVPNLFGSISSLLSS